MTAKPARALCGCGARAIASAFGSLMCMPCFREAGFDDPKLLGGRRPSVAQDSEGASDER